MSRFQYYYDHVLRYEIAIKYNLSNSYDIPRIEAVHFHLTSKSVLQEGKSIFTAMLALEMVSRQKAALVKAKHSISSYRLRKGALIACHGTLRHPLAVYTALEYLSTSVLPKQDGEVPHVDMQGNVSFGITDCFAYKELEEEYDKFCKWLTGLQVTVTMSSGLPEAKKALVRALQLPSFQN